MSRKKDLSLAVGDLPDVTPGGLAKPQAPTLSMEEMKELEAQARAEVEKELKAKLRDDFLAKTKSEMRRRALFVEGGNERGEKLEQIMIDLPKFSDRITLDGVIYMHGSTYNFTLKKAATIKEVIFRQWMHHAEINGLDINEFLGRRKYAANINPKSIGA